jgi:hypothetical protein
MSDGDVDEYIANPASHGTLTHDFYDEVHWPNVFAVSNYIRDIQRPEGLNGRTYRPLQPAATQDPIPIPAPSITMSHLLEAFLQILGFILNIYLTFNSTICEHIVFHGVFFLMGFR